MSQYPQATPLGEPIPFEIFRPLGVIPQAFTVAAAVSNIPIPATADFLILRAKDSDCIVRLGAGVAAMPADGIHTLDLIYVGLDEVIVVDHEGAVLFSVIGVTGAGTLIVQTATKYTDVRKTVQQDRM